MKLRTRFVVSILLFSAVLIAVAASVGQTLTELGRIDREEAIATSIARGAGELSYQSYDYLLYRDVQQSRRWQTKWDEISAAADAVAPATAEQRAIVTEIKSNLARQRLVFQDIARVLKPTPAPPSDAVVDETVRVSWSRMAVQSQSLAFQADRLVHVMDARRSMVQARNALLVGTLLAVFAAYLFLNYAIIYRSWLGSVAELQRGTEVVGSGQLDYAIPVRRKDEIGGLTVAFNRMTEDLRGAVASRAELEHEVTERKQAEEALSESLARTTLLKDIASALASSLDPADLSKEVLSIATEYLGAGTGAVYLLADPMGPARLIALAGGPQPGFGHVRDFDESTPGGRAMVTGGLQVGGDVPSAEASETDATGMLGGRRVALPVFGRGAVIGVIEFAFSEGRSFSEDEMGLYEAVATTLGTGLENARLYETQRHIADRLQEALLSLPEKVSGIEFAHAYRSATESARVGGDFYDLFELSHGQLGITIGDVAGKGLNAAVLTSLAKNTIRAHANEEGKTPSQILALTNEVVYKSTPTESFVTVFFGILDCGSGRLVFANAGHTASAVVRDDGMVTVLPSTGPLLGAFSDMEFGESEVCLGLDELLFLYTDGLTEARRDGELYGEPRLFDFLGSKGGARTEDLIRAIVVEILGFSENTLRDDLAVMAVKRAQQGPASPVR